MKTDFQDGAIVFTPETAMDRSYLSSLFGYGDAVVEAKRVQRSRDYEDGWEYRLSRKDD